MIFVTAAGDYYNSYSNVEFEHICNGYVQFLM